MARKINQYDDQNSARRYELLAVLMKFAEGKKGALPIQRRAWKYCRAAGYNMNEESFNRHWKELKAEGYIAVDPITCTPYIPNSYWKTNLEIP